MDELEDMKKRYNYLKEIFLKDIQVNYTDCGCVFKTEEICVWLNKKEKIEIKTKEFSVESEIDKKYLLLTLVIFEDLNIILNKRDKEMKLKINEKEVTIKNFQIQELLENPTEKIRIFMETSNKETKPYDIQIWLDSPEEEDGYLLNLEEERIKNKYGNNIAH